MVEFEPYAEWSGQYRMMMLGGIKQINSFQNKKTQKSNAGTLSEVLRLS